MEPETKRKIEETVIEILKNSDMETMTEFKVRNMAAEKLGFDLSVSELKQFVRSIVESFLLSTIEAQIGPQPADEETQVAVAGKRKFDDDDQIARPAVAEETKQIVEEKVEAETKKSAVERKFDDHLICWLSKKRKVTIQNFRGKSLVSIREFYEKDGKQFPSSKGISLTTEQWSAFRKSVPSIEEAIKKMESKFK